MDTEGKASREGVEGPGEGRRKWELVPAPLYQPWTCSRLALLQSLQRHLHAHLHKSQSSTPSRVDVHRYPHPGFALEGWHMLAAQVGNPASVDGSAIGPRRHQQGTPSRVLSLSCPVELQWRAERCNGGCLWLRVFAAENGRFGLWRRRCIQQLNLS